MNNKQMMKNINYNNFFILQIILILLITYSNSQPQCHVNRFPEVLPMQFGQQTSINLQQYIWGTNITYSVQPNDFHSNIQPQYTCRRIWSHRLGNIIQTQNYEHTVNNKTQLFVAMLGSSSYYNDLYMVYYGINVTISENNNTEKEGIDKQVNQDQMISEDSQVLVLQVPRYELKDCRRFVVESNGTHAEFILDCLSPSNRLHKIMATTIVSLNQSPLSNHHWVMLQSPIYLPQQLIPQLNITSSIAVIQTLNKMKYLMRMIMTEYADYMQVWRWTSDSKEIIGVYDSLFFMDEGSFTTGDVDLRKMQCVSNTILVMDLINGLHILQLTPTGTLLYLTTLQMPTFTTFHYDSHQQLLFMGKRGIIQQFSIKIMSSSNIRANRLQRYHLYGFEQIIQIVVQSRYLYVSTNLYLHVIHLTNIPSNDQEYDGSYNVYRELYNQMMVAVEVGFVKVDAAEANVEISKCETHPPFLHLKAPQYNNQFTVNAVSIVNDISHTCKLQIVTQPVQADDDRVYVNGYESQNETIYSNRPGRTVMDLDKYAIGKNLQYEITLYNHQIQFDYKIRKVNNQSCMIKNVQWMNNQYPIISLPKKSNVTRTFSVGNWLIVEHPQDRVKQYYKCERYTVIQCNFIQISITSAAYRQSAYQLLQQERTKKESILEAVLFQQNNQSVIEVVLVAQNEKKLSQPQSQQSPKQQQQDQQQQPLYLVKTLCSIRLPVGEQYKVGEIKLREDKLYVVLPSMKQIRVYEALLSLTQNQQCHQLGNMNLSSFKHHHSQLLLYFAPRHVDFDKHALGKPYIVPSFSIRQRKLQSITQSVQTIFITQFNQVLVVRLVITSKIITRIQLLKQLTLDRTTQSNDIELITTLPNLLAVDKTQRIIAQYYISHTFDRTFIRNYPYWFYYNNNSSQSIIRLIDSNRFAVMGQPDLEKNYYAQIYQINSIVSSFKEFAKFEVDGVFHVMRFNQQEYEFVTARLKQTTTTLQLVCNSTTLTTQPYAEISIDKPNKDEQPSREQFYLTSFTLEDSRRQVVTLQVASDSSDIEKGTQYPYTTYTLKIQEDQNEAYFQIDDLKWFSGNIWSHRYVCNDCKTGRITFQDKISLKKSIQLQAFNYPSDFYVNKIQSQSQQQELYEFQTIEGYLLTKMKPQNESNPWMSNVGKQLREKMFDESGQNGGGDQIKQNVTYVFSQSLILSSNIQNQPKCIKSSPQDHDLYFVSMCSDYEFLDDSSLIQLRLYSTTGFKPFVIHQYLLEVGDLTDNFNLQASTKSQTQLIVMSSSLQEQQAGNYDTVFVRFDDNIWVFLVVNGKLQLIYTVDKVDFGPDNHLCWIEVVKRKIKLDGENELNRTITQYGVIASMCESGLYHIVFTVDPPQTKITSNTLKAQKQPLPSFHLLTQQQIDMQVQLQRSRIQLPQHSYFLQTIPKPIHNQSDQFQLHMIVSNFNSFIWKVSLLKGTLIISGMQLTGIIRRYNQYSPIQVTSNDDRYFSVLYRSIQNANVSEFLALYDTRYYVINQQKEIKQYEMFSVYRTNDSPINGNKSEVFQIGTSLFVLRQNKIRIFEVDNVIKMRVQKKMPRQVVDNGQHSHGFDYKIVQRSLLTHQLQHDIDNIKSSTQILHSIQQLQQTDNQQYPILYSQSIVIFVQTPTQVNSATIKLYSFDYFELSGWIIALIVLGGVLVLGLLYYGLSGLWRYYQKQRKLVRLETILDEASSSERGSHDRDRRYSRDFDGQQISQQVYQRSQQGRQSQITTEEGTLSKSLLQKYRNFQPKQEQFQQQNKYHQQQHYQTRNEEETGQQTGLEQ